MSKEIFVLLQPSTRVEYWFENTLNGIISGAKRYGESIRFINKNDIATLKQNTSVLVVGNDIGWMRYSVMSIQQQSLHPILVSASMLELPFHRYDGVMFELSVAIENCVHYLLSAGRHNITLLGITPDTLGYYEKYNAFMASTQDVGEGDFRVEECRTTIMDCIEQYLQHLSFNGSEAAMCANDTTAICLMLAAMQNNISLPDSLFITGMGNSYLGQFFKIPLTTIAFDYRQLGYEAVNLLHVQRRFLDSSRILVSLPCSLEIRASTGNIPYSADTDDKTSSVFSTPKPLLPNDGFYIRQLESIFQECDSIDRAILIGMSKDRTCISLSKELFLSERAIRYRIQKLQEYYGIELTNERVRSVLKMISV